MADTLAPQYRELAGRCALVAAQKFRAFGWTWGYPDSHEPDVEEIAAAIERLIYGVVVDGSEARTSGRLQVQRNGLYGVEVLLHLGGCHEDDGVVDVDDELKAAI